MTRLMILGCGGFGREVFGLVAALGSPWQVTGFLDDAPSDADLQRVARLGSAVLGGLDRLADLADHAAVLAIGAPAARANAARRLATVPVDWPVLVHPAATVGLDVRLDAGTVVAAGARLSTGIDVGRHVHVDANATIGHDTRISDFARVNPGACISGGVEIGNGALVGARATVLAGLRVGDGALVGAAACVVRDVAPAVVVMGVPAR